MDPALSLMITVCMRVLHTEDSIVSDDIYSKFKLLFYLNNNIINCRYEISKIVVLASLFVISFEIL